MRATTRFILALACTLYLLAGCSKKEIPGQTESVSAKSDMQEEVPHFKKTEKFGIVSNIVITPTFQPDQKYAGYVRQEVSEVSKEEYRKLPDSAFENYIHTWIKQAAAVEKPNWNSIAGIMHPETSDETNQFKIQEIIDKTKAGIITDKSQLNVMYGWQGKILSIKGYDIATGEYYLSINPGKQSLSFSYKNDKNYSYNLSYQPQFESVGMTGDNLGAMQLTIKVPVEKAKEIEALRETGSPMIRVYGHVTGLTPTSLIRKDFSEVGLTVQVEALEFGIRKNGEFKTFFFLDTEQLKRSKS